MSKSASHKEKEVPGAKRNLKEKQKKTHFLKLKMQKHLILQHVGKVSLHTQMYELFITTAYFILYISVIIVIRDGRHAKKKGDILTCLPLNIALIRIAKILKKHQKKEIILNIWF